MAMETALFDRLQFLFVLLWPYLVSDIKRDRPNGQKWRFFKYPASTEHPLWGNSCEYFRAVFSQRSQVYQMV